VVDAEPGRPVAVLNHDHGSTRVGEDAVQLAPPRQYAIVRPDVALASSPIQVPEGA
jgi:hypothetical protein